MDFVRAVARPRVQPWNAEAEQDPVAPMRAWVKVNMMGRFGVSSKFVLRKLTAAVLPQRKEKHAFIRETLRLPLVPLDEHHWDKEHCEVLLLGAVEVDKSLARIPVQMRVRAPVHPVLP